MKATVFLVGDFEISDTAFRYTGRGLTVWLLGSCVVVPERPPARHATSRCLLFRGDRLDG